MAFAPFAMLDWTTANHVYVVFQVCVAMAGSALLGVTLFRSHRFLGAAAVTLALLGSWFFWSSVHLYNVSLLLLLPLVAVARLWSRERWAVGTVVLGISVAIKPLLMPLFLVPVLRRRLGAAVWGAAVVLALTVLGAALSHDLAGLTDLPRRVLLGASHLGDVQIYNVSPNSVGVIYPQLAGIMTALRIVLAVGVVITLWRIRRWRNSFETMLVMTGILALTIPLVGTLSEVHYGVLAFPVAVAMITGRLGRAAQIVALLGAVPLAIVMHTLNDAVAAQIQLCVGQVTILVATFLTTEPRVRDESLVFPGHSPVTRRSAPQPAAER
jgi:arabinofuranan 3-O-arabinosyltransferase